MGFRAVGTNDGSYMGIGGQNTFTGKPEDPTKKYVNIYIESIAAGTSLCASVDVKYLLDSLQVEGFIASYTLPEPPKRPLTQVERIAKALLEAANEDKYTDDEFRQDLYYTVYVNEAEALLKEDN